jgi:endonuclease I
MTRLILILAFIFQVVFSFSQWPAGYYDSAIGKKDTALQAALHNIIKNHTVVSYSSLHSHYQTTDKKPNGKVWDMYSDVPGGTPPYQFTFMTDKCGSYSGEGDCYNREHSFPQSWFNKASPMKSDLFHVYPTDGYVNGKRSSYPYGEVSSPVWTSLNGSKLGPCSAPGYSGTVFEPIDEYKGDFARTYFYMAVRYYTEDAGWQNNAAVNGSQMKPWFLNMLYQWHLQDTVSQKEIDRNNAVYNIQHNRNPFIDRPDWVDSLWFPSSSTKDIRPRDFKIKLYPNPVNNILNISILSPVGKTAFTVTVYDVAGRVVTTRKAVFSKMIKISTADFQAGIYFVSLVSEDSNINLRYKFIKQ